jgi:ABC-2 type transport system ATP-binding protein
MSGALVEIRSLTKRFGSVTAVDELTFDVLRGQVVGFLGPNGAGKTTTMRALLGLVRPTSGTATIAGRPYAELGEPMKAAGAVLEATSYHPARRALDHLQILATTARVPVARAAEALDEVGLSAYGGRKVGEFSLGMRQRLALAAALLGKPELLVLDEPANGLDPEGIQWLRGFLRYHAQQGGTVLLSSHVLSEVAQIVDEVVIIARGRLVTHAPVEELINRASDQVMVRSPDAERLIDELIARGHRVDVTGPQGFTVADATSDAVGALAAETGAVLHELTPLRSNLEDVFMQLTADEGVRGDGPL